MLRKNFYLLGSLFLGVLFISCSKSTIPIQVLVPAEINVPQHIKRVVVANRSLPADDKKVGNFIEGLVTGESIYADREGSEKCVTGLVSKLNNGPRFQATLLGGTALRGTGTKSFPAPLEWFDVDRICQEYDADALILLETFDSDISLSERKREEKRKQDDKEYTVMVYYADLNILVSSGWRIYDNINKRILDQNVYTDSKGWTGKGNNPDEAKKRLPSKRNAINDAGYFSGERFAFRISPNWQNTSRLYFTGKIDDFKQAKKYVQNDDWEGAVNIWKRYVNDPEKKIGGRACFNMGIASEIQGNFTEALDWMKKAYYTYDIKQANQYIKILNQRIADQRRLKEQMGEEEN